ncbi:lipase/acyltransferase domain-containing protein [Nocardia carnea]|uniref:lipase/acyltransferase domain-containing protein n=1 Tax=Nocardia carnea TaxID=37328 RepID=UPI002455EBE5|nr:hypothetical protein [Nocardia carnea]
MGSELVDEDGTPVWGLRPAVLHDAWMGDRLSALHVTDDELAGRPRLRPTRLLRVPAYTPFLRGCEPYSKLLAQVSRSVIDPRAMLEFPYDWRLSIRYNAECLVKHAMAHLERWRTTVTRERLGDSGQVRLVLVAHSMGGLVARYASVVGGLAEHVRAVITLGTPYFGAVRAVQMLATGAAPLPVPARTARALAETCPGVYDLLPRFRCVADAAGTRPLTVSDVVTIGGRKDRALESAERWGHLNLPAAGPDTVPETRALVGAAQPTLQSLTIQDGSCDFIGSLNGIDHGGDATVHRGAAAPGGNAAHPLPQNHGALASSEEALNFVHDKLVGADTTPELSAARPLSVDFPDMVAAGTKVNVCVRTDDERPSGIGVRSAELASGRTQRWSPGRRGATGWIFTCAGLSPGPHRIEVGGGGGSAVSEIVFAVA